MEGLKIGTQNEREIERALFAHFGRLEWNAGIIQKS